MYEANLLALLPRIAGLFGLPAPESVSDLMDQIRLDVLIRSISAALAGFVGSIGLVALYVAFMLVEQKTFVRKIDFLFPTSGKATAVRAALNDIESRIERYLWIKTLTSLATAGLSWLVLVLLGCQNASFWALVVSCSTTYRWWARSWVRSFQRCSCWFSSAASAHSSSR